MPAWPVVYTAPEVGVILQGDIIADPELLADELGSGAASLGYVILTSSCDLVQEKADKVVISPVRPLKNLIADWRANQVSDIAGQLKQIMKHNYPNIFMLPPSTFFGAGDPHYIELAFLVALPLTNELRTRLMDRRVASMVSPYREKLGYALGQYFSRVGLPPSQELTKEDVRFFAANLAAPP